MTSSDCQGRPGKKEEQVQARALVGQEGPVKIIDSSGHGQQGGHQNPYELRYDPDAAKARLRANPHGGPTEIDGHVRNRLGVSDHRGQSK